MSVKNHQSLKKSLKKDLSCYVLITCSEPEVDGQMKVEMSYKGDAALASYLLQGAQLQINQEEECCQKQCTIDIICKS